jgi:hypothetical protein
MKEKQPLSVSTKWQALSRDSQDPTAALVTTNAAMIRRVKHQTP